MIDAFNALESSANKLLQKLTSGIGYLGQRKICLLGGGAILVGVLTILMVPSWLYSSAKSTEKNQRAVRQVENSPKKCQLTNGKTFSEQTVLNETLILNFLTDPRASQLLLDGRRKMRELGFKVYPDVQQFGKAHPDCPEVQEFVKRFPTYFQPLPYEEVWLPFLGLGVANTTDINEPATVKTIQAFQVRIFKYWLSLYRIGKRDEQLANDLLIFCRTSSLDLFSKLIGPMLETALKEDDEGDINFDYEDIIFSLIGTDCFVDGEWAPDEEELTSDKELTRDVQEKIQQIVAQQVGQHFAEQENKKSLGEKIVEEFEDNLALMVGQVEEEVTKDHFSKDAIIGLFLEITESK